jgi:hypothetical protein
MHILLNLKKTIKKSNSNYPKKTGKLKKLYKTKKTQQLTKSQHPPNNPQL